MPSASFLERQLTAGVFQPSGQEQVTEPEKPRSRSPEAGGERFNLDNKYADTLPGRRPPVSAYNVDKAKRRWARRQAGQLGRSAERKP